MSAGASFPLNNSDGAAVTVGNSGASTVSNSAGLTYRTAAAAEGSTGVRAAATGTATFLRFLFAGSATSSSGSFDEAFTYPSSTPPSTTYIVSAIDTGGTQTGSIVIGTNGNIYFSDKNNTLTTIATAAQMTAGTKYRVRMGLVVGSTTTNGVATAQVFNYSSNAQVGSTVSLSNANLGTVALKGFHCGVLSAVTYTVDFDIPQLTAGTTTDNGKYVANTTPPVVTAGPDQTISSTGGVVPLTSSATPASGSAGIASYAWSAVSWPGANTGTSAPSITGASSQNASFSPSTVGRYIFAVTATDVEGNTSLPDYQHTYVPGTAITPIEVVSSTGGWTGVVTDVADSSDSTVVAAPNTTGAVEVQWTAYLSPLISNGTTFTLVVRDFFDPTAVTGAVFKVRLIDGSTTRKEWTVTPTTTLKDDSLTLTTGEMATITNWNTLKIQLAYTTPT